MYKLVTQEEREKIYEKYTLLDDYCKEIKSQLKQNLQMDNWEEIDWDWNKNHGDKLPLYVDNALDNIDTEFIENIDIRKKLQKFIKTLRTPLIAFFSAILYLEDTLSSVNVSYKRFVDDLVNNEIFPNEWSDLYDEIVEREIAALVIKRDRKPKIDIR